MTIIDNIKLEEDSEFKREEEIVIPAVYRNTNEGLPLSRAVIISVVLHILFFSLCYVLLFIFELLGINFNVFNKPELPMKDIEFVLVTKEAPPIDKNTKFRADKNSRAGGKHDPSRPVSEPEVATPKAKKSTNVASSASNVLQNIVKKAQPQAMPQVSQPKTSTSVPKQSAPQVKAPTSAKAPAPKVPTVGNLPKPTVRPKSSMQIPYPKTAGYSELMPSVGGPVSGTKAGGSSGISGGKSLASAPVPSFSPSKGGAGYGSGAKSSSKGGNGVSGNYGNPGPGNIKGAPGIDAIKEPDFGPYMKELQRRIKMNWNPPKGNESKRVVLLFSISRDGRLLSVKVHKSSGLQSADQAAIQAVQLTAPFKPLPVNYRGSSVDIQFTFDYNVFGASRY